MIAKSEETMNFINDFQNYSQRLTQGSPQWLREIREQSLLCFHELGIPTIKNEDWKYTDIRHATNHHYHISKEHSLLEKKEFNDYLKSDKTVITFINGSFSKALSRLNHTQKGIKFLTVRQALEEKSSFFVELLQKYNSKDENVFTALNQALTEDGILINVDDNVIAQDYIHVLYVTSIKDQQIFTTPRTIIKIGKSSELTVLESHISFSDQPISFTNSLTDISLAENSTLHYYKAQKESAHGYFVGNTRVSQERNSNFDNFVLMLGGAIARHDLGVALNGEGINATLNGLYHVAGSQHVDNHTCVDHRQPNCTSNQLYKGILNGSSRAVFNGKIFVRPIAQKTNSYQLNKNLLLGKSCRVDTKPQLEIFADDVKCTHGATIGQMNMDEIFYLQSRCIPRQTAVIMLAQGFVDDVLNRIQNEAIHEKMHYLLCPLLLAYENSSTHIV